MHEDDVGASWGLRIASAVIAVWLLAPIAIVIPLSFTDRSSFLFPPKDWSLRFYRNLFEDDAWRGALLTSISLAVVVAVASITIGTLAAFALFKAKRRWTAAVEGLLFAPMILPSVVLAVALFSVYLRWHLVGTFTGFVIAHTVLAVPFSIITVRAGLQSLDPDLERASASLGASPLRGFFLVTLPVLLPSILAGMAFSFMVSFDEVVVALFIQSPNMQTLPVQMWTSIATGSDPTIAAAATMTFVLSFLIILIWQYKPGRRRGASAS
jgi:putative spermidine/putrescine transport system permease protein